MTNEEFEKLLKRYHELKAANGIYSAVVILKGEGATIDDMFAILKHEDSRTFRTEGIRPIEQILKFYDEENKLREVSWDPSTDHIRIQ